MEFRSHCACCSRLSLKTNCWRFLSVILFVTSLIEICVCQPPPLEPFGYISIDCGGESGEDPQTKLNWVTDNDFLDSAGQLYDKKIAVRVNVVLNDSKSTSQSNAKQLETAMVFIPGRSSRSKYCYNFNLSLSNLNSRNYLVRAMFPSKNLNSTEVHDQELKKYSTRFYLTVDSTFVSTIDLEADNAKTLELFVTSIDDEMYICLVPLEDKSSMPAISSLELRSLPQSLFPMSDEDESDGSKTLKKTTFYLTLHRLNFGRSETLPAVRLPDDQYDRLWYGAPAPENVRSKSTSRNLVSNLTLKNDSFQVPLEVWTSAWEGVNSDSVISFTVNISAAQSFRPFLSFSLSITFFDVDPDENSSTERRVYIDNTDIDTKSGFEVATAASNMTVPRSEYYKVLFYETYGFYADSSVFNISRSEDSIQRSPMVNAFDLYGKIDVVAVRMDQVDASTIHNFSDTFEDSLDTAGDPCLPVPWNWLVCSVEVPPRITQINLTSLGLHGKLLTDFGKLNRLTVLDLSNNTFHGSLPESVGDISTLRVLDISDNNLSSDLSSFSGKSLTNLEILSLRNNNFRGTLQSVITALRQSPITTLDLSRNNFSGPIPEDVEYLENLEILNFSYNHLDGQLQDQLIKLQSLKILSLENNSLSGIVPDYIWSSMPQLQTVNLSSNSFERLNLTTWCGDLAKKSFYGQQKVFLLYNNITTVIFGPSQDEDDCLLLQSENMLPSSKDSFILLGGNDWCKRSKKATLVRRYLCRTNEQDSYSIESGPSKRALIIGLAVCGFVVLLMAFILLIFLGRMWKRMKELRAIQEELAKDDVRPPFYKYEDLKAATKDFSQENQLGKGAFGAVYKAELQDKQDKSITTVAVKQLFLIEEQNMLADFLREVVLITGIKHKHLIQLKGCCVRDKKRFLVYEYAENGNLAQVLWGNYEGSHVLTWEQRLKICIGIAKGLSYLHEELQPTIIHRDIKAQNILLDTDWRPKIADFGLARPMNENIDQRATTIGGTLGYFSPEYATQGLLTEKLDVYSYGVLLLEIVAGRPCIDKSAPENEVFLKNWALKLYKEDRLARIAEDYILAKVPAEEIESVLKTALLCLQEDHERRPSMSRVVNMLTNNISDVAIDIVSGLKDQQFLISQGLFEASGISEFYPRQEREDHALLNSTPNSSFNPKGIELNELR